MARADSPIEEVCGVKSKVKMLQQMLTEMYRLIEWVVRIPVVGGDLALQQCR